MTASGAILFGRYAFAPNRLGYCGPDDNQALLEYVASRSADAGLLELERRFEGAYPYLRLIAEATNIADPFDDQVVEAYWIGNSYLEQVGAASFYDSLTSRFRSRMDSGAFTWLTGKLVKGARPHHNFHVLDVYMRAGLMQDNRAQIAVDTMDACRISWGRVVAAEGSELVVERPRLVLVEGKLALTHPEVVRVTRQIEGLGFADDARPGSYVSIHWHWTCEELSPAKRQRLIAATRQYIQLANQTL
jgi:hypothetical protein